MMDPSLRVARSPCLRAIKPLVGALLRVQCLPPPPGFRSIFGGVVRRRPDSKKILVVDDDPDWREFLRISLEDLGYLAVEVASGLEALELLERDSDYRLVLLDLNMPGMNGDEVAQRMPSGSPHVVFLTSADAQRVGKALGGGPHYYLPKGATQDELALLLQSLQH
jgi:two-component system, chemotaxis family, chemotaxis protein CheY